MVQITSIMFTFTSLILIAILVLQTMDPIQCTKFYGRHSYQLREKPRSTRGFKSVALSTARGFGKRDPSYKVQDVDLPFSQKLTQKDRNVTCLQAASFPVNWLFEEVQNDPELMRTLIRKFIDTNQDDEISADELIRPELFKPVNNFNFEDEQ